MEAQEISNIDTRDVQKRINQGILEVSKLLQAEAASEVNSRGRVSEPMVVPTEIQDPEHGIFDEVRARAQAAFIARNEEFPTIKQSFYSTTTGVAA